MINIYTQHDPRGNYVYIYPWDNMHIYPSDQVVYITNLVHPCTCAYFIHIYQYTSIFLHILPTFQLYVTHFVRISQYLTNIYPYLTYVLWFVNFVGARVEI